MVLNVGAGVPCILVPTLTLHKVLVLACIVIQRYIMIMHLQESYDHPIAYNESARISNAEKPKIPSSVATPDDNHHERMTW